MNKFRLLPLALLILVFTVTAYADRDAEIRDLKLEKDKLNSEIQKLNRQIASTDSMLKADDSRYKTLQARYKADTERRRSEIDTLNVKIKNVAAELQTERNKQARAKNKSDNVAAKRKALREELAGISKRLEAQVAQTLPWERESRLDRVKSLTRDIESGNASEEEAFSRLKSLVAEETYSDDNGTVFGVLVRKMVDGKIVYEWNEDLNLEERAAVKLALDVKQAKKPPQVVKLPVSLSVVGGER